MSIRIPKIRRTVITTVAIIATFTMTALLATNDEPSFMTVEATGTYLMSDDETLKTAKAKAQSNARDQALKKAGTYISSLVVTENSAVTENKRTAISANIISEKVLRSRTELLDGRPYYLVDMEFSIDTQAITKHIKALDSLEAKDREIKRLSDQNIELKKLVGSALDELAVVNRQKQAQVMSERHREITSKANKLFRVRDVTETPVVQRFNIQGLHKAIEMRGGVVADEDFKLKEMLEAYASAVTIEILQPKILVETKKGKSSHRIYWPIFYNPDCDQLREQSKNLHFAHYNQQSTTLRGASGRIEPATTCRVNANWDEYSSGDLNVVIEATVSYEDVRRKFYLVVAGMTDRGFRFGSGVEDYLNKNRGNDNEEPIVAMDLPDMASEINVAARMIVVDKVSLMKLQSEASESRS